MTVLGFFYPPFDALPHKEGLPMLIPVHKQRFSAPFRGFVTLLLTAFLTTCLQPPSGFADILNPGVISRPGLVFKPLLLEGIQMVPGNPLRFNFLADQGNSTLTGKKLEEESIRLVKYFLTALTVPERDLWVNLSPYEKDSIIADTFAKTQMGKVLLEQDHFLKQITASLTYPERPIGQQFWSRVYQKAYQLYGTTDIPVNAFNKVWVVPKTADVVVYEQGAYIVDSKLDVMVESDYLARQNNGDAAAMGLKSAEQGEQNDFNPVYLNILKEVIIPELRREVNEGKDFAPLRQTYHALILATWYKRHLRNSLLSKVYVRQGKVDGINVDDPSAKEKVYQQYLETFRKGVYNYIREDFDEATKKIIPRKYTSGGMEFTTFGLGGPDDPYRELTPLQVTDPKSLDRPLLVETDLNLLTSDGDQVGLPGPVKVSEEAPAADSKTKSFNVSKWLKRFLRSTLYFAVLSGGMLFSNDASGAQFSQDSEQNLIIQIERGDTYGEVIQKMRVAYQSVNPSAYQESNLFGPLWGPQGVVERMSGGQSGQRLLPGDQLKFAAGVLPQEAVQKLAPGIRAPVRTPIHTVEQSDAPEVRTQIGSGAVEVEEAGQSNKGDNARPSLAAPEPGLGSDILGTLVLFGLFWGTLKIVSGRKKKNAEPKTEKPKLKKTETVIEQSRTFNESIKFVTVDDELPSLDDAVLERTETINPSYGVFAEPDEIVPSDEEAGLWEEEQLAAAGRSSVKPARALWPMDLFGSASGAVIVGFLTGWNPLAVIAAAVGMFFITRLSYGIQIFVHEFVGHFIPSLVLSPERAKVMTLKNFLANFDSAQWKSLFVAGTKAPAGDQMPGVDTGATGWRKKFIDITGFFVSMGVAFFGAREMLDLWVPLIAPFGISALAVMFGSYKTDIKGNAKTFTDNLEECNGRSQCGIFGALWAENSNEMYPSWIRDGFTKLVNSLIIRGGQSAGEFTIGLKSTGKGSDEFVPVLSKVLKYKRGQGLSETLDTEFGRLVGVMEKKKVQGVPGVKGILGHVRFATGGKVTREASHPHMGVQEEHAVWGIESGRWVKKDINVFVAIGHNGDNDIWNMWGLKLNTSQMRDFFPALFRMEKTFKVVLNKADPVTGKNKKEVQYEALPPGDSPPLALQIHYLLTQGDWIAASRFAYADLLLNYDVLTVLKSSSLSDQEMSILTEKKLKHAMALMLSEGEERALGEVFQEVFKKHAPALLRPKLNKADKSFKDLWVTKDIAEAQPSLSYQYEAIRAFQDDLKSVLVKHLKDQTSIGKMLLKTGDFNNDLVNKFISLTVEKFFTGSRAAAVEEFAHRSEGTYGVAVRTSKEPNGVTLYSSDQGVTIGYSQKERLVTFSSEHSTLQHAFGEKGKMDDLIFVNPEQPGQMADVNFSKNPQAANPISIRFYSFALKRTMTPQEIAQQQFPQDADNPYWSPQVTYKDPTNMVMEDVQSIPKEVLASRQSWSNPDSFNRQSADAMLEKMASRHLEYYIKANSEFYSSAQGSLMSKLFEASTQCLIGGGCSSTEANQRSARLSNRLQADGRVVEYLKSRLDWIVGQLADDLSKELLAGKIDETDMVVLFRQKIDERLKFLLESETKEIVNAVIGGNLTALQSWTDWEKEEKLAGKTERDLDETSETEASSGLISQGLRALGKIAARFMSSKSAKPEDVYPKSGRSLEAGETDMLIAGYENSLWFGENFVAMMKVLFPQMNIWSTSANKAFNLSGDHRIGRRTMSVIISKSGATFPSRGIVRRLKQIAPGNIFAMTSRIDTLIAMGLGQKFQADAPFIKRIFVTGNYYPAEANSVGEVMLFAQQIELALHLAEGMRELFPEQRPWGMNVTSDDIARLKVLRDNMYDEARRLTGHDEKGNAIDGAYVYKAIQTKIKGGYLYPMIRRALDEKKGLTRRLDADDIKHIITRIIRYDGPESDSDIQAVLSALWNKGQWDSSINRLLGATGGNISKLDEKKITNMIVDIMENGGAVDVKKLGDSYLSKYKGIKDNAGALGKTMTETGIVTIIFRIFVMSIFWFGAPIQNLLGLAGFDFGPSTQDFAGFIVRTFDGILALLAPWLMTTLLYRAWSGRPTWARMGPPTVTIGDSIPALHQTGEGFWSKLGAVAFGPMTMNVHGANPEDHFVARLAHRVVRGTVAIFGVPADPTHKDNVMVTMKQTKAIINGIFMEFFKGGAQIFSIGRGALNNPDVTDHHMDIGVQNLEGASKTVKDFNYLAFDAFGRQIAYKVLFTQAYDWATRWEFKISLFGKSISLKKFQLWNPAWTYSRTGVHTTRSPKGGPTDDLPEYLSPEQEDTLENIKLDLNTPTDVNGNNGSVSKEVVSGGLSKDRGLLGNTAAPQNLEPQVNPVTPTRGGIDFHTKWLDLRVTETGETEFFLENQNIESMTILGVVPTILDIRPVDMERVLLLMNRPVVPVQLGPLVFDRGRELDGFTRKSHHADVC